MPQWDHAWKSSMRHFFYPIMRFLFPKIAAEIDETASLEFLDKEIRPVTSKSKAQSSHSGGALFVDFLVRVTLLSGEKQNLLVHIEFQNQVDLEFERRMFLYYAGLIHSFREDVLSLAILGDPQPHWRPQVYQRELLGNKLVFEFQVAKLCDYRDRLESLLLDPNPFALMVAAHLITQQAKRSSLQQRLAWKTRLFRLAVAKNLPREEVKAMVAFVEALVNTPLNLDDQIWKAVQSEASEEECMGFIDTATRKMVEAEYQLLILAKEREREEALARVREREQALAKRDEVIAVAERNARAMLVSLAESKLGPLPESTMALINSAPLDRLQQWGMDLLSKNNLEEVFGTSRPA